MQLELTEQAGISRGHIGWKTAHGIFAADLKKLIRCNGIIGRILPAAKEARVYLWQNIEITVKGSLINKWMTGLVRRSQTIGVQDSLHHGNGPACPGTVYGQAETPLIHRSGS